MRDPLNPLPGEARQTLWRHTLALALLIFASAAVAADTLRIGLTPVFLDDQVNFLRAWRGYLERELKRPVEFVRRSTYAEIVDLLRQNKLDFAWLCGYPYVTHRDEFDLLAIPVYQGRPLYQSYLIVPANDDRTQSLAGLKGRVFAFSDPNSNSGYLVPQNSLAQMDAPAQDFFLKSFFTGSHRGVIEAVAAGLADGGSVDGYVYDAMARLKPAVIEQTRIVERSPFYGFPPFVTHRRVRPESVRDLRRVLLTMSENAEGRKLLQNLFLDGFARGTPRQYEDIEHIAKSLKRAGRVP